MIMNRCFVLDTIFNVKFHGDYYHSSLYSQLNFPKVVKMSKLLEVTISSYYPAYKGMVQSVEDGECPQ